MAPRQRNISASTVTPAVSEDEDSSSVDDGSDISLMHEEKSRPTIQVKKTSANIRALPKTLHITEADVARDNHDYFNILALPIVVVAISMNHDFPSFHYTGNHFWTMWGVSLLPKIYDLYFIQSYDIQYTVNLNWMRKKIISLY